jgi:hypothetical protein
MLKKIGEGLFRLFAGLAAIWVIIGLIYWFAPGPFDAEIGALSLAVLCVPAMVLVAVGWGARRLLAGR